MADESGYFDGPDNTRLFYQCWLPKQAPRAALILVHGLAEHSGRYMNLVKALVPKDFSVYGLDHYGHGKSGGKRLYVPDFNIFTRGLDRFVDRVRQWEKGGPVFLVGHSMGGLISCAWLGDHQDKVDGAVLSGPAVKIPGHVTAATRLAAAFFSLVAPKLGIKQVDADGICRDPAVVTAYLKDPLVSKGKVTARLAATMLTACERVMARAPEIRLPILTLQGGADTLVDPEGANQFHERIGSRDKDLVIYPEKFHEIFNDPGHDRVFGDILDWLEKRLPPKAS